MAGALNVTMGKVALNSENATVVVFPATSVAMTGMLFTPEVRTMLQLKFPGVNVASTPLQVRVAMPESVSRNGSGDGLGSGGNGDAVRGGCDG